MININQMLYASILKLDESACRCPDKRDLLEALLVQRSVTLPLYWQVIGK